MSHRWRLGPPRLPLFTDWFVAGWENDPDEWGAVARALRDDLCSTNPPDHPRFPGLPLQHPALVISHALTQHDAPRSVVAILDAARDEYSRLWRIDEAERKREADQRDVRKATTAGARRAAGLPVGPEEYAIRNRDLAAALDAGRSLEDVADEFRVSPERALQIAAREHLKAGKA